MKRPQDKFSVKINDLDYEINYSLKEKPSKAPVLSKIPRDITTKSNYMEQPGYLVQLPYFYRSDIGVKKRSKSKSFDIKSVTGRKDRNSI